MILVKTRQSCGAVTVTVLQLSIFARLMTLRALLSQARNREQHHSSP